MLIKLKKQLFCRYIKVLVQEMSLKVDIGFLLNMHEFYKSHKKVSKDREVRIYK